MHYRGVIHHPSRLNIFSMVQIKKSILHVANFLKIWTINYMDWRMGCCTTSLVHPALQDPCVPGPDKRKEELGKNQKDRRGSCSQGRWQSLSRHGMPRTQPLQKPKQAGEELWQADEDDESPLEYWTKYYSGKRCTVMSWEEKMAKQWGINIGKYCGSMDTVNERPHKPAIGSWCSSKLDIEWKPGKVHMQFLLFTTP